MLAVMVLGLEVPGEMAASRADAPAIEVVVGAGPLAPNDEIRVTVRNVGPSPIRLVDQQSLCGVVVLERRTDGDWLQVAGCMATMPSRAHELPAGRWLILELQPPPYQNGVWSAGTYRVRLPFKPCPSVSGCVLNCLPSGP
ncbi:MAG: hypothetical protein EXQ94_03665 [Alphaproteobacteria bacterium]|nr:hypothetical protein [Alphaproteobacteria bacterium]